MTSRWISNCIFQFGQHRGKALFDVPVDYLRWVLREIHDEEAEEFRQIVRDELHRRQHEGVGTLNFEEDV